MGWREEGGRMKQERNRAEPLSLLDDEGVEYVARWLEDCIIGADIPRIDRLR
jgi:hypothetical protein